MIDSIAPIVGELCFVRFPVLAGVKTIDSIAPIVGEICFGFVFPVLAGKMIDSIAPIAENMEKGNFMDENFKYR